MLENIVNLIAKHVKLFFLTIISLFKILIRSKWGFRPPLAKTTTCYILGNGPSLSYSLDKYFEELKSQKCALFTVNSFALASVFRQLKPQYYIFLDPYFTQYDGIYSPIESVKKTYDVLQTEVTWPLTLFIPSTARKNKYLLQLCSRNPHIQLCYYNYVVFEGYESVKFNFFKWNLGMPQCQNILGACIFIATNMQFKEIRLLGADHSWHEQIELDNKNQLVTIDKHFYNQTGKSITMNTRVTNRQEYGIHTFFASLSKAFYSYKILAKYATSRSVKVVNASEKSYIDAFERI